MTNSAKTAIALAAVFSFISISFAFADPLHIKLKNARFRAGPGTSYKVLWEAPMFTPLEYLAKYKDWYAVRDREGDVAWVSQQAIGQGEAAIVINKKANIRKGPGTRHQMVFTVDEGYLFKVIEKKGNWYKVKDVEGDEGWVLNKLIWVSR